MKPEEGGPNCVHLHLVFKDMGKTIGCVDCPRTWKTDEGYSQPFLTEWETRHNKFVLPRTEPKKQ